MEIIDTIKEQIANNPVLIYMKGAPNAPQCGFSARASQALMACHGGWPSTSSFRVPQCFRDG